MYKIVCFVGFKKIKKMVLCMMDWVFIVWFCNLYVWKFIFFNGLGIVEYNLFVYNNIFFLGRVYKYRIKIMKRGLFFL